MMPEATLIYDHHWGGGSTKRWTYDKYLISATFWTGSSLQVELLDHPGIEASGWWYMSETIEEATKRLISKLENICTHATWREQEKDKVYGTIKFVDKITPELVKEIEAREEFQAWEEIHPNLQHLLTKGYGNVRTTQLRL